MFAVTTCFGYYCMSKVRAREYGGTRLHKHCGEYNAWDAAVFSNAPIYLSKSWQTGCQPLPRNAILLERSKVQPVFGELPRNSSAIGQ